MGWHAAEKKEKYLLNFFRGIAVCSSAYGCAHSFALMLYYRVVCMQYNTVANNVYIQLKTGIISFYFTQFVYTRANAQTFIIFLGLDCYITLFSFIDGI